MCTREKAFSARAGEESDRKEICRKRCFRSSEGSWNWSAPPRKTHLFLFSPSLLSCPHSFPLRSGGKIKKETKNVAAGRSAALVAFVVAFACFSPLTFIDVLFIYSRSAVPYIYIVGEEGWSRPTSTDACCCSFFPVPLNPLALAWSLTILTLYFTFSFSIKKDNYGLVGSTTLSIASAGVLFSFFFSLFLGGVGAAPTPCFWVSYHLLQFNRHCELHPRTRAQPRNLSLSATNSFVAARRSSFFQLFFSYRAI